jgi:uncharacterized protein (DUF58 family)
VPGAGLVAIFIVSVPMAVGRMGLAVGLDMVDRRVEVGQIASGSLQVRNVSPRRTLPASIRLPVGAQLRHLVLPALRSGQDYHRLVDVVAARRGVIKVGPIESLRGDPLGLVERSKRWSDPIEIYVHPPTVRLHGSVPGTFRDLEGQTTRELSDRDIAFYALREYQFGDDARNIHWLSSARSAALMVKQFEDTRRVHSAIVLDTAPGAYGSADDFELAVAAFASIGRQNLHEGRAISAFAGTEAVNGRTVQSFLDGCCRLELASAESTRPGLAAVVRGLPQRAPAATFVVIVSGGQTDSQTLGRVARLLPQGITSLGLQCQTGAEFKAWAASGRAIGSIGALEDLPRLIRAVTLA